MVPWRAMEAAPAPSAGVPGIGVLAGAGLVGAVAVAAMFAGGGSGVDGILPVGGAAVGLLAGSLALFCFGRLPLTELGRPGWALVALAVLLVVWTGATIEWSIVA